jgi:hypothetical protein
MNYVEEWEKCGRQAGLAGLPITKTAADCTFSLSAAKIALGNLLINTSSKYHPSDIYQYSAHSPFVNPSPLLTSQKNTFTSSQIRHIAN